MVVKADQQKIKALLKDTITLLCKNGLNYSTEFCVEALIGITLDKDDVMLVSINETVKSVTASGEGLEMEEIIVESDDKVSSTRPKAYHHMHHSTPHHSTPHHSTPQRKRSLKVEPPQDTGGGEDDGDNSSLGGFQDESSSEPPLARKMKRPKVEQDDDYNDDDAVVIKEEMEDWASASNSASIFGDISGGQPSGQQGDDVDLQHVLQSGSLVPVSSMQGGTNTAMWQGQAGGIRTSTVTSDLTQGDTQDQQQAGLWNVNFSLLTPPVRARNLDGSTPKKKQQYVCNVCGNIYGSYVGYRWHVNRHRGVYPYVCKLCQKGFMSHSQLKVHRVRHCEGGIPPAEGVFPSDLFAHNNT